MVVGIVIVSVMGRARARAIFSYYKTGRILIRNTFSSQSKARVMV